jgi:hypothetical protein
VPSWLLQGQRGARRRVRSASGVRLQMRSPQRTPAGRPARQGAPHASTAPCRARDPLCRSRSSSWRPALPTCESLPSARALCSATGSRPLWKGLLGCPRCLPLGCRQREAEPVPRPASSPCPRALHQTGPRPLVEICTLPSPIPSRCWVPPLTPGQVLLGAAMLAGCARLSLVRSAGWPAHDIVVLAQLAQLAALVCTLPPPAPSRLPPPCRRSWRRWCRTGTRP